MKVLFSSIGGGALLFPSLLVLPIIFSVLIGLGFTQNNIVEDDVYKIWAKESSPYYQDSQYAEEQGQYSKVSSLLASASSRDGKNILTASRLEEIRTRMEVMESVTVEHDGNEFTWEDICASNNIGLGTVYQFPCVRLTPMDLFQEARWFMSETDRSSWYLNGIKKGILTPRVGRFGIMVASCAPCSSLIGARIQQNKPLQLFSDLTGMEMNDPCRICVETEYDNTMEMLTASAKGLFGLIANYFNAKLQALLALPPANQSSAKIESISYILTKSVVILEKIDRATIEEFFMYYTARGLYQQLGASTYIENYPDINQLFGGVMESLSDRVTDKILSSGGTLDATSAGALVAKLDLGAHADAPFSSKNTAGNPYPIPGGPQGGSGIDFSGKLGSSAVYFDLANFQNQTAWTPKFGAGLPDPDDEYWNSLVETDPMYKWFMAGETKMTAHCGNEIDFSQLLIGARCTKYSLPLSDEENTVQHFAKMWYDLLIDSENFLNIDQGESDPYTWTSGEGCAYDLAGERATYTNMTEASILKTSSGLLYFIDEGVSVGALEKSVLIGGTDPSPIELATESNPLKQATSLQNIYPTLIPENVVDRVINVNRPGGPLDITEEAAEIVIEKFKKTMVDEWSDGWDDESERGGEVQFTALYDGVGVAGTFNFVLRDISDDSAGLTLISIGLILLVSVLFLSSLDMVKSRIGITTMGVILVLLSFLGALGFSILVGIKINLNMAWTLPFIMIGLGVNDMYIVLSAVDSRLGDSRDDFADAMKDIVVPVTMTSAVNCAMFFVIYIISDIGAVYKTALSALIAVFFSWISTVFCFPAYCYLDIKRQAANSCDVLVCIKKQEDPDKAVSGIPRDSIFFLGYKYLFLNKNTISLLLQIIVILASIALVVIGGIGIGNREVGVGIQEFFPKDHEANRWAEIRNNDLASWPIGMSWGRVDYTKSETQLKIMKQFEDVVNNNFIARSDTKWLWIADFNLWTTRHCTANFAPEDPNEKACGRDITYTGDAVDTDTRCEGKWTKNTIGLSNKIIIPILVEEEECNSASPFEGGICRRSVDMFQEDLDEIGASVSDDVSYCPVFEEWSKEKLKFCVEKWRYFTGGSGGLLVKEGTSSKYEKDGVVQDGEYLNDGEIESPIPISNSPTLFANKLFTHEDTVKMIRQTREFCDDDSEIHCFLTGIPFDYWEQYLTVDEVLLTLSCTSVAVGFVAAFIFLLIMLNPADADFGIYNRIVSSLLGAILIAITIIMCLVPVIGLSFIFDVSLTAFSNMAFVLSVGFATEYSIHVVHRFLSAPTSIKLPADRIEYTMKFLAQPLTLSFLSSAIGVLCLAFTKFSFNERFFFRPLIVVMGVTFFIGTFFLPIILTKLDFEVLKVGHKGEEDESDEEYDVGEDEKKFKDDEV